MAQTVFYAWQSDRPDQFNRSFIRGAAQDAIDEVAKNTTIEDAPELDHDTKNTPGFPDIPNTVFDKINSCSIFLADLTLVGQTSPHSPKQPVKYLPNSNVMYELGYAMARVSPDRIICVMNTAFGDPAQLPFDLRHRRHVQYHLCDKDESRLSDIQKKLASDLCNAIRDIFKTTPRSSRPAKTNAGVLKRIEQQQHQFEMDVLGNRFHNFQAERGILALSLLPEQPLEPPISFVDPAIRIRQLPTISSDERSPHFYSNRAVVVDQYSKSDRPFGTTELHQSGNIYAADGNLLRGGDISAKSAKYFSHAARGAVPYPYYEKRLVVVALAYLCLQREIGIHGPIHCHLRFFRVLDFILVPDGIRLLPNHDFRVLDQNELSPARIKIDENTDISSPEGVAGLLKPAFDSICLDFCSHGSFNFDESGKWKPR
ncbi:MAG: hypothetical protein IT443_12855 [Phycisphaeraceae bacterium]|nr:hypothetical protein [Phycisphaeraceae bacterium]